jgi:hypothetical protein
LCNRIEFPNPFKLSPSVLFLKKRQSNRVAHFLFSLWKGNRVIFANNIQQAQNQNHNGATASLWYITQIAWSLQGLLVFVVNRQGDP